jgi:hypothetical protein
LEKLDPENNTNSIIKDQYFDIIVKFLLSLETADDKKRIAFMRSQPNKVAYKWVKQYDLKVVQSGQILITWEVLDELGESVLDGVPSEGKNSVIDQWGTW